MKLTFMFSFSLIALSSINSGCSLKNKFDNVIRPSFNSIEKKLTEQKTISISCGREDIQKYKDEGWNIVNIEESSIPCTWKTKKANSNCNINKDKGCRITVPDKMGKRINYLIEKEVNLEKLK